VNWTSTQVLLWQIDCDTFRKVGRAFELREVNTKEHEDFCEFYAARYGLTTKREGNKVVFYPPGAQS
jgi:hypothetical protein